MYHELKCWEIFFSDIGSGKKDFTIRNNDRNFQAGDQVRFLEWSILENGEGEYGPRYIDAEILYVFTHEIKGMEPGYCIFNFRVKKCGIRGDNA